MNENAPQHRERLLDLKSQTVVRSPDPQAPATATGTATPPSASPSPAPLSEAAIAEIAADPAAALREATEANRAAQEAANKE